MLNPSTIEDMPPCPETGQAQIERFRERLKLIEARVQKQSQEEKLNQVRALLREEATQILLPALQDAMAQMTLQVLPDTRMTEAVERTSVEVGRLAEGMGSLAEAQRKADESAREATERMASTMEAMFAATAEEVANQQSKSAETLLSEQRLMSRRQRFWTVAAAGVLILVTSGLFLGTMVWWRWDQRSKLDSEVVQMKEERAKLQKEMDLLTRSCGEGKAQRDALNETVERLRAEEVAARLKIREAAETMGAVDLARAKTQEDIKRLQDIQERNRFKLIPGSDGAVFVETAPQAMPFSYQGKTYVRVREMP